WARSSTPRSRSPPPCGGSRAGRR
ncbi:MAG: hypothetical protein AVDCRST_MAG18-881, partial [uncultured Thermomicrobiales bacterium]